MSTTYVAIPPTRNPQKASERYMPMVRLTKCSEDSIHALIGGTKKHRRGVYRRCGQATERPRVRRGCTPRNRPACGRGSDTSSGAEVDSLCGVQVDGDALDAIARRLGV